MSMLLDRLLMWIAGVIDRNLLTVPDLDDDLAAFRAELTRPNDHDARAPGAVLTRSSRPSGRAI